MVFKDIMLMVILELTGTGIVLAVVNRTGQKLAKYIKWCYFSRHNASIAISSGSASNRGGFFCGQIYLLAVPECFLSGPIFIHASGKAWFTAMEKWYS